MERPVRLLLMGPPAVEHGGRTTALPFERRTQLLALLAARGTWVPRTEAAALIWPDQGDKLAATNLRKALFRAQALPWAATLEAEDGALRFAAATDVTDFEAALREGRIVQALAQVRGEFLAEFDGEGAEAWSAWLGYERTRLRAAWRQAALDTLAAGLAPAEAIALSARLLEADPLDESALRAHMAALASNGQALQARQAWRAFVARMSSELGLAPGPELQALNESLGIPARSVRDMPKPAVRTDGFIGRQAELRQLVDLLGNGACRLVCLTGPGGVGKTRLARRALDVLRQAYPDGAVFVPLEDATAPEDIVVRLWHALQPSGRPPGDEPISQVARALSGRRVLAVLDNFEHLASHAVELERLLEAVPGIALLVTSRLRLGLCAEQRVPLEGLPCPDPEDLDHIEAFDAVRLFVKAARRVEPALLPAAEAGWILEICRLVDGLPLAIELAAAWTRVLSCEAIAQQLREGLALLESNDPARPARHASLDVVFDETWRLLTHRERDVIVRLAVFHGGFEPEAARAVADAPLPVLAALVDKSLLRREGARLHPHPLLLQWASARLRSSTADESTHVAHAKYFLRALARMRPGIESGQREALDAIDREFANVRAAWEWACAEGPADALLPALVPLTHHCDHRRRFTEGLAMLHAAAQSPTARRHANVAGLAPVCAALLEIRRDRYGHAEALAHRSLERAGNDDVETRLRALRVLGACQLRTGRLEEAHRSYEQALALAPASVDPRNSAAMLDSLALVEKAFGRYEASIALSRRALLEHRRLRDPAGEALCLNNLASLLYDTGDVGSARSHLEASVAMCERHGLANTRVLALCGLAEIALNDGELAEGEARARDALGAIGDGAQQAVVVWLRARLAHAALRRRDVAGARAELAKSLESALAIEGPSLLFEGLCGFVELLAATGHPDAALQVAVHCASHPAAMAVQRDRLRALAAKLGPGARPWPGWSLEDLARRVVTERDTGYAALLDALGAPTP